eukprot:7130354-Pyramimonas_sp.AAC.1
MGDLYRCVSQRHRGADTADRHPECAAPLTHATDVAWANLHARESVWTPLRAFFIVAARSLKPTVQLESRSRPWRS